MMQAIGRRYVRHVNDTLHRTGTLWEGRYKSCLVDSERYVLECYRYIELNPVRAAMVDDVAAYPWSSYRFNGLGHPDQLVSAHCAYERIATDPMERRAIYRQLVAAGMEERDLSELRQYTQRQRAWGSPRFQEQIETALNRRATIGRPGRPRKSDSAC